jgi:hypothetical protein
MTKVIAAIARGNMVEVILRGTERADYFVVSQPALVASHIDRLIGRATSTPKE